VLWRAFVAPYAHVLAAVAEPLIRIAERPAVTRLIAQGSAVTIDRADFPPASPRPALELLSITANIIMLTTLFAVGRAPLRDRNVRAFLTACVALAGVHVAAVVLNVESIYALRLGPWSAVHYGAVARNLWGAGAHFYTLIGSFGAGFALWWLFRPAE
jgi:hypothetical protein